MGDNIRHKILRQGVENIVNRYEKYFNFGSKYVEKQWDSSTTEYGL